MDFVEGRIRTRGAYGAYVRGYDSQRSILNNSDILLLSKYRLRRQPYRIANVLETNVTSDMYFVEGRTRTCGAYGAYVRGYDLQRFDVSHSAILLSKTYRL